MPLYTHDMVVIVYCVASLMHCPLTNTYYLKKKLQLSCSTYTTHSTINHVQGGCQNVVRFSGDGSRIGTGGADGRVRIWTYPSLKVQHTLTRFKEEVVECLSFHESAC